MTRELLEKKQIEYQNLLLKENPRAIEKTLRFLDIKRNEVKHKKNVRFNNGIRPDDDVKRILDLLERYAQDIKMIFISNNETITHVTIVSPNAMRGGKIVRSLSRANNYETESGDWVFASSEPMDNNPYLARNPDLGMIMITPDVYIFGGNNIDVENNRAVLKRPNYIYRLNPEKFTPVVTLRLDRNGKPYFEFSEEWVSDFDVDISDKSQVLSCTEVLDVTDIVKNYQVLCDIHLERIAMEVRKCKSKEEAINLLIQYIKNGKLRYINGETKVNSISVLEEAVLPLKIDMSLEGIETENQNEKY